MPTRRGRVLRGGRALLGAGLLVLLWLLPGRAPEPAAAGPAAGAEPETTAAGPDPLDRVQLHRNANRGVPYLELARPGDGAGAPRLVARPVATVELDGDPLQNAHAGLRPIDVDGDGTFEFLHHNGFRWVQVWDAGGRRLWRVENPAGRLHRPQAGTHRDAVAVLDLDGDGKQDVAHCWAAGGRRALVYRRGLDGAVIRATGLTGSPGHECQMAAFRVAGRAEPLLLVAGAARGPGGCARGGWVGEWARTLAFDLRQRPLWARRTCGAGHHAWPVDADRDGAAEAIFVGKYLLRPGDGGLACALAGWPERDHVDGLAVADFDPARPGLEAVAVGDSGVAMFDAATCRALWRLRRGGVVRDPQHVAAARLDPAAPAPAIAVAERGTVPGGARTFLLDGQGRVLAATRARFMPVQNADLDGARGVDELVGGFGEVLDRHGNVRLDRSWYWRLRGNRVRETGRGPYPASYDRWQAFPLVYDHDGDGRDELVQWGQSLIVVGKVR
jgi:hypothetical protein